MRSLIKIINREYDSPDKEKPFNVQSIQQENKKVTRFYISRGSIIDLCLALKVKDSIICFVKGKISGFLELKSLEILPQDNEAVYIQIILKDNWTQEQINKTQEIIKKIVSEEVIAYEKKHGIKKTPIYY